jgi:hypothetical protein
MPRVALTIWTDVGDAGTCGQCPHITYVDMAYQCEIFGETFDVGATDMAADTASFPRFHACLSAQDAACK